MSTADMVSEWYMLLMRVARCMTAAQPRIDTSPVLSVFIENIVRAYDANNM